MENQYTNNGGAFEGSQNRNPENGMNMDANASASGGSPSGAYGYSYVNQEQKNPNNIWRADENTASAQNQNARFGQGTANRAYGPDAADGRAQNMAGGAQQGNGYTGNARNAAGGSQQNAYGNIYGTAYGQQQGGWNAYAGQNGKDQAGQTKKHSSGKKASGFGIKLAKCASIALVFGLVSGTAFEGTSYLMGNVLGNGKEESVSATAEAERGQEESKEDEGRSVLSTTDSDSIQNATAMSNKTASSDIAAIAQECMPSIVAITNMSEVQYQNWFGQIQNYESKSAGSGIIVSEDDKYLYIATNNHVVESATTLTIQFCDDTTASAEVKGTAASSDLAVVQVEKSEIEKDTLSKIKIATMGDSSKLQVGAEAIAIGNALGYGQSVTTGVISALEREVKTQDEMSGEVYTNTLLQTDAAINPGNSGGALLNNNGEVIGINSSKYSDTTVEGMGFAIPINMAKPIIEDLITREVVAEGKQAFLGIKGVDVTTQVAKTYDMPEGIFITEVTQGSAAERAELQRGDIITQFDGKEIRSMEALQNMLTYYEAGSEVTVTIQRSDDGGYKEMNIQVKLGKRTD